MHIYSGMYNDNNNINSNLFRVIQVAQCIEALGRNKPADHTDS